MAAATPAWADPAAFTNALAASCRARRWQHAFASLEAAKKQDKANVIHFNVILRSCQQAEAWETSLGVLGSLPGLRMHPDAVSWTAVITGLKPFWRLSSHLLHTAARRGATDSITFGAASLAFERDGLWNRSLALQTHNQQEGGLCDAVLVGSATSACDKGCAWADSLGLLSWASASSIRLSDICFSAATSSSSRSWQWEVALSLLQSSAETGFQTSLFILNSAESAVAKAGSWWGALSILRIFPAGRVEPDAVSHNACLTSLKPGGHWEEAAALLSSMQQSAVPVGDVSINAALAVLWEAGRWPRSLTLLHRQALRSMDGIRLRETLALCEQAALWDLALDLLQWQATTLLQPSTAGICSVARACERARQWQQSLVVAGRHSPTMGGAASMSAEELLQSVWIGAQQLRWDESWETVAQALASNLGQLSLEDLATALWSFGTLSTAPASFLEEAAKEAVRRLELGEATTPRTLADLAWGFATLGFPTSRLFDVLQLRLFRWDHECDISCRSNSERAEFLSKAQVVVWAASHMGALHETVWLHLQDVFRRLADLLEAERGTVARTDTPLSAAGFRGLPVPHVVQNFHDRFVLFKPEGWQVDDGSDDPPAAQRFPGRLSDFVQSRLSAEEFPILREAAYQRGFLHRLDVPTSGLVLVAKTLGAYLDLRLQMAAGKLAREYVVVLHGSGSLPCQREVAVRIHWGMCGRDAPSVVAPFGKPADTRFKLLARMALGAKLLSLAVARIGTGRRHQIRLHAAHIGHPVAADGKYSCHSTCSEDLLWCPSTFLHRYRLAFWAPSHRQPDAPLEANDCRLPLPPPMRDALRLLSPLSPRSTQELSNWISGDPFDLKPFNDY
ncbi:rluD [Symbiodinium sp. CCMP2592]|nr:rluD [Symbiodinium sp. CCMP2592]